MKRVEDVEQETDTELEWTAKIFFSAVKGTPRSSNRCPASGSPGGRSGSRAMWTARSPFEHTGNLWRPRAAAS
jgi:hypothetical protein